MKAVDGFQDAHGGRRPQAPTDLGTMAAGPGSRLGRPGELDLQGTRYETARAISVKSRTESCEWAAFGGMTDSSPVRGPVQSHCRATSAARLPLSRPAWENAACRRERARRGSLRHLSS